ncbi:MAG: glycoside hydrolase family 3 N-terminal domain-containing protein [Flavobacteriales bacterium]
MIKNIKIVFAVVLSLSSVVKAQQKNIFYKDTNQKAWVDSIYNSMTQDERIGQLFMVATYSNRNESHKTAITKLIKEEHIGGLIFMQNDPVKQAVLTNYYQENTKIPLLIGIDGEWGLDMRLKNTFRFPWNMTLGAVQDDDYIYEMGVQLAQHCKRLGIHMNFAPVVDVNTNPENPIIGNRSFGSDVSNVARKGQAITQGMQDNGVIASAKHFPGHGDTKTDSHEALPIIAYDRQRLNEVELYPFKKLIDANVGSIMVAHLNVPSLESNSKLPSSISPTIIGGLLKKEMGYQGLIITDALNMKGVADLYPPGEVDLMAFKAGNDILLFSQAVQAGKSKIKNALNKGIISEARLEESVKKILNAKYFVGLNHYQPINLNNIINDLNDNRSKVVNRKLVEESITVLKNEKNVLPIVDLADKTFAYVHLEEDEGIEFYKILRKYVDVKKIEIKSTADVSKLKSYDYVFVSVHKSNKNPWKSYKISENTKNIIKAIATQNQMIVSVFASPYSLLKIDMTGIEGLVLSYQNSEEAQNVTPQIIFGALPAKGKLPVTLNKTFKAGYGIVYQDIKRLGYAFPEYVDMSSVNIKKIDEIAQKALTLPATPGMQVLVARDGKVIFEKSYGYKSKKHYQKVKNSDLYDLASITKIAATLPMIFKLKDEGKLDYDQPLIAYTQKARGTNKANLTLREILAHQAGLKSWIPFYKETLNEDLYPSNHYYSNTPKPSFKTKIADGWYIMDTYKDSILSKVYASELGSKKYSYSDLGYYIMQDIIETKRGKTLDKITKEEIYKPLGAYTMSYLPLEHFEKNDIIPTEMDTYFRKQLIQGYVHDQGAAMKGGVAGHAGVFSDANDLAKLMQLYLQKGYYGGKRYFQEKTIEEATEYQYKWNDNRRGLGFDKKPLDGIGQTCKSASESIFGHSGFTGTITWVDPDEKLVYVFLSNRINQQIDSNVLSKKNIREDIFQAIYDAIMIRHTPQISN